MSRMPPVCSAENASVENQASTTSHTRVGNHQSRRRCFERGACVSTTCEDKAFRPIPPARLFNLVVRGFTRDDDVMHVALSQSGAADADKPCLLLQVSNGVGAAVTHAGA